MRTAAFLLIVFALASPGYGQSGNPENWCRTGLFTRERVDFRLGTVKGPPTEKAYFYSDGSENCPSGSACRGKAYLVGGDQVVVSKLYDGFACSWFIGRNGRETVGWLPEKSLTLAAPDRSPRLTAWLGTWAYAENRITFTDNKLAGFLNVTGDALWKGLGDNVHVGELDGRFAPEGNLLEYSDGDDEYDCRATMRLVGDHLVVADNMKCGGANVTFSGVYKKFAGKARP